MDARRILIIAGSDSSGGAGLEADQKVVASHGCYAMTATTALTAQNTRGVQDVHHTPPQFVKKQIDACIEDIGVDVVKIGMLASEETVSVVADAFRRHNISRSVVDPVMVSTSGHQLLPPSAVETLRTQLLPLTTILTPNIPEAQLLLTNSNTPCPEISSLDDLISTAKSVHALGPKYVLLKGGHLPLPKTASEDSTSTLAPAQCVTDVLVGPSSTDVLTFSSPYISSRNTHGTGCSLASAVACNLVLHPNDVPYAIKQATSYISSAIRLATPLGKGHGPINHFHSLKSLPFAPGRFLDYLLNRPDVAPTWHSHVHHPFLARLADGTLPLANFKFYLMQDYRYLIHFARANALAAYKAKTLADVSAAASIVAHVARETQLHVAYCESFGVARAALEAMDDADEHQACTAYTRYVLDVGASQDWFALQVAFMPCLLGYGEIAARLSADRATVRDGNVYYQWVENYVAGDYVEAVRVGRELLEREAVRQSPERIEELVGIFVTATRMEKGFWEMGAGYVDE